MRGSRLHLAAGLAARVPPHLKNSVYGSKEDKELSSHYKYPHDYGGYVEQQYLPDGLKGRVYYKPKDNGYEKTVKEIRKRKGKPIL